MSKVTMPEPVAWAHFTSDGLVQIWSRRKTDVASLESVVGRPPEAVITTTQAEAYAAARVREALEEATAICEAQALEPECPERAQYCADAIRALIPQQ